MNAVIITDKDSVQNLLTPFCFVLGKDTYGTFPAWWSWQAILNFIIFSIKLKN